MSRPSKEQTELARMRNAAGIKQECFARDLGVSPNHYAMVERGERQSNRLTQRATTFLRKVNSIHV
jgi:DNA-binding transcriptional regulator YiaG